VNPQASATRSFTLEPFSYAEARALMRALDVPEPIAVTLVRRGYRTVEEARAFLEASETHEPFAFESMREIVDRIERAIRAGERITVHGDYDCDGVSATTILVRALRERDAECDWYIPGRLEDGYGLTREGVERLAARGTRLLITVDCGITCPPEVAAARAAGMDVIVTDHHEPGPELPDCSILHPRLGGYPFGELCAAGVAHKLAAALIGAEAEADLDLVALATVADLVPLQGENRALVRKGLAVARSGRRPGLRALCAAAKVPQERLDEGDLAFRLGPRINAAGRLYRADAGVELMLTSEEARATAIATELNRANSERRTAEREVVNSAETARADLPERLASAPALVLAGTGWHPGVVGIAASRLAERHWVPTVLIGLDSDGRGRGSGRSIPGFDLLGALDACAEHLERHGGHRAAAGLEIRAERIDAFREAFAAHAETVMDGEQLVPTESIDAVVGGESLGHDVAEQLERLAPFGMGNPGVRLLVPSVRVRDVRPMGDGEKHARFRIESGARSAMGVAFSVNGALAESKLADPVDVSVKLELNEWNGAVEPRVVLGELYRRDQEVEAGELALVYPDADEWRRRFDAERAAPLGDESPPPATAEVSAREVVDRRGDSGVAAVAALASCREAVLVVCSDALRRRELVERAAAPARFCGGPFAIASGRLADDEVRRGIAEVLEAGCGVALADWASIERGPAIAAAFAHVVVVDPPPFAHLERAAAAGDGFLHLAWGAPEITMALRVHEEEWPRHAALAALYRVMRERHSGTTGLSEADLREVLHGPGRHPRAPEVGARRVRVLEEMGAVEWNAASTPRSLRVVSSVTKDLELTESFAAYRGRYEEGRRFLSRRKQPS